MMLLAACGSQQPTINPDNAVPITRTDGVGTLARATGDSAGALPDSTLLAPGDQLYTAPDQSVTLQFRDGSTLQLGPDSHLALFTVRPADGMAVFRLLAGSVTGDVRSNAFEVQAYKEVAMNFRMVLTDLTAVPRGTAGTYQLGFDGNLLKAVVNAGEFDLRSGNQQATLPPGWQAIAEPGEPLQVVSLITPTPSSADEALIATPIRIISITPTNTPTETPLATKTATATATRTPTRTPTRAQPAIIANTPTPVIIANTPIPAATEKPERPPKPTNPPPPPPPTEPPPPPPTEPPPPPPTDPPPDRPTPTPGG